jgi:RNA recognition motif. (a.k.a. RRM, RBD, or RNP domain)
MQTKPAADQSDRKVIVRIVACEATAKDVRGLLESFGHVKTCRLPKKVDGSKRGFAFVEFADKVEAPTAMAVVCTRRAPLRPAAAAGVREGGGRAQRDVREGGSADPRGSRGCRRQEEAQGLS